MRRIAIVDHANGLRCARIAAGRACEEAVLLTFFDPDGYQQIQNHLAIRWLQCDVFGKSFRGLAADAEAKLVKRDCYLHCGTNAQTENGPL